MNTKTALKLANSAAAGAWMSKEMAAMAPVLEFKAQEQQQEELKGLSLSGFGVGVEALQPAGVCNRNCRFGLVRRPMGLAFRDLLLSFGHSILPSLIKKSWVNRYFNPWNPHESMDSWIHRSLNPDPRILCI